MRLVSILYRIILLSLTGLLSVPLLSFAQQKAANATSIMEQISENLKGGSECSFKINSYNKNGTLLLSERGVAVIYGEKFSVTINNGTKTVSDGKSQWFYNGANNEIIIGEAASGGIPVDNPFALFSNPALFYKIDYGKRQGELREIVLSPRKEKRYSKIKLFLNNNSPERISIEASNGNRYNIELSRLVKRTNLPEKMFVLNPKEYKGAVVTDLR